MSTEILEIQKRISPILKKYKVKRSSIFGSYARGENNIDSDLDLLVDLKDGKTYFDLIALEDEIEKALNKKIDLLTFNSINPLLKENILKDEIKIYAC